MELRNINLCDGINRVIAHRNHTRRGEAGKLLIIRNKLRFADALERSGIHTVYQLILRFRRDSVEIVDRIFVEDIEPSRQILLRDTQGA